MNESRVTIVNTYGFHVRPTTQFVELARSFDVTVHVEKDGMAIEANGPMGLLALGAMKGDEVTIRCEGPQEIEALAALVGLIESSFGGIE
ncbi:MAG: HPr family phosphocarrier protein [Planctomycetota bacterium]|jgi:phosphocarrier protein